MRALRYPGYDTPGCSSSPMTLLAITPSLLFNQVRALKSDAARLIHQRLCGWIDPGESGRVTIDVLCSYVWPDEASPATMRKRRQKVRKALEELKGIGWTVKEYAKGKYKITRPKPAD